MAGAGIALEIEGRRAAGAAPVASPDDLVREHFATRSNLSHANFKSMQEAISALCGRPSWIVETGSSAWGTDSSRLFDSYVATFGGRFWSVDSRLEPMLKLRKHMSKSSSMSCDDSVRFLKRWVDKYSSHRVDLVYLDSFGFRYQRSNACSDPRFEGVPRDCSCSARRLTPIGRRYTRHR